MNRSFAAGTWILSVVACSSLAVAATIVFTVPEIPPTLNPSDKPAVVPVAQQDFDDQRIVALQIIESGAQRSLVAKASGTVTEFICDQTRPFVSGASSIHIDGQPLLNFATTVPPWRDLVGGDTGEDVRAVQSELVRLGYDISITGRFDWSTWSAYETALEAINAEPPNTMGFSRTSVLWLPAAEVPVSRCEATVGQEVGPETVLVELPVALQSVVVDEPEPGLFAGAREIVLEEQVLALPDDLRVTDPGALAVIAQLYTDAQHTQAAVPGQLAASIRLREPIHVSVLPASAIVGFADRAGCVVSEGQTYEVEVLSSSLGQTFVTFANDVTPPTQVDASPDISIVESGQSCSGE